MNEDNKQKDYTHKYNFYHKLGSAFKNSYYFLENNAQHLQFVDCFLKNDFSMCEQLLSQGLDINSFPNLLLYAVQQKEKDAFCFLANHHIQVNSLEGLTSQILDIAIKEGKNDIVQYFFSQNCYLKDHDRRFDLLNVAIKNDNVCLLESLIISGIKPEEDAFQSIVYAAQHNNLRAVQYLLDYKACVQQKIEKVREYPQHYYYSGYYKEDNFTDLILNGFSDSLPIKITSSTLLNRFKHIFETAVHLYYDSSSRKREHKNQYKTKIVIDSYTREDRKHYYSMQKKIEKCSYPIETLAAIKSSEKKYLPILKILLQNGADSNVVSQYASEDVKELINSLNNEKNKPTM